jgi:spermidine synthase
VPRDTRIVPFNQDARLYFNDPSNYAQPYDVIIGDAFNDLSVPYHLTTSEFAGLVHQALAPDGIYMVNIIDHYQKGQFLRAYVNTLKLHFPHVYVMGLGEAWKFSSQSTYVVVATKQPLDLDGLHRVATRGGKIMVTGILPQDELDAYLTQGRRIILTDDYAPVDQLLAPLFDERGF